jgi:hypothetical protein
MLRSNCLESNINLHLAAGATVLFTKTLSNMLWLKEEDTSNEINHLFLLIKQPGSPLQVKVLLMVTAMPGGW